MAEGPRYHAIRKIADGGSAEVFLGEQLGAAGFKRPVVLKRIRPALFADEEFREMLLDEANLAMSLHHPNLVEVLDVGESNGRYFLVLELVDGWTLGQVARRGRDAGMPMPPELCVYVAAEVCRGLSYAHQRTRGGVPLGIVHRDICPNNVLVSMHADVKVTDFGIARASTRTEKTGTNLIRGKPMYMSPEQTRAEPLDARSDLFSVGTVLYSLLTGQLPFPGPGDQDYLRQISDRDAPSPATVRPELPPELCRLVQKAMARKREDRFATAHEMLAALEHVQRSVLKPAGRSELEAWLRTLSVKDGVPGITRQTLPPAPPPDEPEWISLSAEQSVVADQTATQQASPAFIPPQGKAPSRVPWPLVAAGSLVLLGAVVLWWRTGTKPPEPLPIAAVVVDAGAAAPAEQPDAAPAAPELTEFVEYPMSAAVDAGALAVDVEEEEPEQPVAAADSGQTAPAVGVASRSGTEQLKLSARLAPNQKPGQMVAVAFDSEPGGVAIRVDKRVLGHTPVTLSFRNGITYDVWFDAPGQPPLRQWLMLTERTGKPPKVTLRAPVE